MARTRLNCVIVMFAFAACGGTQNDKSHGPPTANNNNTNTNVVKLQRSQPLPKLARQLLHKRMHRHAGQMQQLFWAALTINRPLIQRLATAMSDESRIAKPSTADLTTLNHVFPKEFFALQDELRAHAADLAAAARRGNDATMAASYGKLTQTCVSCHALYLSFSLPN